ncbi:PAS domain-containing sensor histidine kinase, partial [filamentous cyanobacterium LEGE 11480]
MSSSATENSENLTIDGLLSELNRYKAENQALREAWQADITKRDQMDAELRDAQRLLQLVMDTLPASIFWKDRNSVFLGCNTNFAKDAGFDSPADLIAKTDDDCPWTAEESA